VDHAKRDRRRHRLENEKVDEKYVVVEKIEKVVVGDCRKQSAAGLTVRHCDVGLTSTWLV